MFTQAYKAALSTIKRKPFMLWGLSLLSGIICTIATITAGTLGFIGTAFGYVISVGMAKVYLDGLEGKEVNSDQLFSGFTKRVFRVAGGMAWRQLWSVIWAIACICVPLAILLVFFIIGSIPVIGFVFSIIGIVIAFISLIPACIYYVSKTYSYAFVPYILATKPDVTATQALRLSMELTNGKKVQMWLADFLYGVIVFFVTLIIGLFACIPYVGFIFGIILFAWILVLVFFGPLFKGLYMAEFYRIKPMPKAPKAPKIPNFNGGYGAPNGGYGAPHGGYGAPHGGYGAPQQGYGTPQQNYGAPQQNYGAPQQNYGAPQQNYGAPQQNYGAPQQNFNQNNQ